MTRVEQKRIAREEMINELIEIDVLRFTDEDCCNGFYLQEKLRTIFRNGYMGYEEYSNQKLKEILNDKRGVTK